MIVRDANVQDRFALVRMGRAFFEAGGLPGQYDPAYAEAVILKAIAAMDRCALVLDIEGERRGALLAVAGPHGLLPMTAATELVWWIDPQARSPRAARAMLEAYEAWAARMDAEIVGLAALDARVAALYRRRGYRPAETHWMKAL